MTADRETASIVRSWLREDGHESADRVVHMVLARLDTTRQRRSWSPVRRITDMTPYPRMGLAIVLVAIIAIGGAVIAGIGAGGRIGGAAPTVAPTVVSSPSSSPTTTPSAPVEVWPTGQLEARRYAATVAGIPFSFSLPSPDWSSFRHTGMLETGWFPTSNYAWIGFGGPIEAVATDPCRGASRTVGPSLADQAEALTTIPGTEASRPSDITLGGRAGKLVELTIHPDIACRADSFWLFGQGSAFPNSLQSTIRVWLVDVAGTTFVVHSDQAGPNPALEAEIEQIADSIRFD